MSEKSTKEKILIVDDNKQNIDMLMNLFKDEYKIVPAINPQRALALSQSESPPDIILLDILMPEMDGYEVCKILKQNEKTKDIPVIFVTAVSEVMDAAKGFAVGAIDYITKPFHPPMVKARVEMQLDLKRKYQLLEQFAFLDPLTEIPNRRRFNEVIETEWNRAMRSDQWLALLMVDIDHFKYYNDTYGHGKGDTTLKKLAKQIKNSLRRAGDFVSRYGGEEFVVLLPYSDPSNAIEIGEHIRENVESMGIDHSSSSAATVVTISVGATAIKPNSELTFERLVERADNALYEAKNSGRNCVRSI